MTKIPYIDRLPPTVTGDVRADLAQIVLYQRYITERMNYIIGLLNKTQEAQNNGN